MSTRDHPDWWRPMGGQNSQDSILERRSLVWNDDEEIPVADRVRTETSDEMKGKFFTRGCRGKIEQIQVYSRRPTAGGIILRLSPHPCLGPFNDVTLIPGVGWGWWAVDLEEMWDYDSLFLWFYDVSGDCEWVYDAFLPYDGHVSVDAGATWADLAIRPFIRVVYTGETPGDVPVSGIINNIQIPNTSSDYVLDRRALVMGVVTTCVDIHGAGYTDLLILHTRAIVGSESTGFAVYCDEELAWFFYNSDLNDMGMAADTPSMSLTEYAADADCTILLTKKFEFRRRLRITAENDVAAPTVDVWVYPTLLR